jgi:hypothetical protein
MFPQLFTGLSLAFFGTDTAVPRLWESLPTRQKIRLQSTRNFRGRLTRQYPKGFSQLWYT